MFLRIYSVFFIFSFRFFLSVPLFRFFISNDTYLIQLPFFAFVLSSVHETFDPIFFFFWQMFSRHLHWDVCVYAILNCWSWVIQCRKRIKWIILTPQFWLCKASRICKLSAKRQALTSKIRILLNTPFNRTFNSFHLSMRVQSQAKNNHEK